LNAYARTPKLWKTSFTLHVEIDSADQLGHMYLAQGACLGIAPVAYGSGRRLHNVTLVLNRGGYDARGGVHAIVAHALRTFGVPFLEGQRGKILTSGPFDWPVRQTTFNGAALVGDAAGYYDPFTGQGIFQAIASAELLAEHAGTALRNQFVIRGRLHHFARAQQQLTAPARTVQRLIEFVCARPGIADTVFRKCACHAMLANALVGVTGDLFPARRLLSPALLARLAA
jgi:hypothetical protein